LLPAGGDQLKALAERLRFAHQIDATAHVVDLRKAEDIARLAKDSADIDILVNNAGDIPGGSIDKIDEATWRHAWELKVFGYINLTRAIYAQMKSRGHGVIVNDIGAAGEKFDANYIAGSAGNAALMAFTRALGSKSLADNIRVVGINPGPVGNRPPRHSAEDPRQTPVRRREPLQGVSKGFPLGRPAHAREIGDLMAFLASDRSRLHLGRDLYRRRRHQRGLGVVRSTAVIARSASDEASCFVIPGWCVGTRPQMRSCASGNLEIPGSMLRIVPGMTGKFKPPTRNNGRIGKKRNEERRKWHPIGAWCAQRRARSSKKLNSGEVTPLDLLDVLEQRIAEVDGKVNALPTLCFDPRPNPCQKR